MIKHLGEELVPFETSGFSRTPETPLPGETVTVRCRMDQTDLAPALELECEGSYRTLLGTTDDQRYYSFSLGAFDHPQTVRYRFLTGLEQTRWFSFDVVSEERIETPLALSRVGDAVQVALCEDATLTVEGGDTLRLTLSQAPHGGELCDTATLPLPQGFSITCGRNCIWSLNRLSVPVAHCLGYTLRRNARGRVVWAGLRLSLTARHIMGTGERFHAVDQTGSHATGRVVEKFTHQGEQAYLPVPFFMTEQGLGWHRQSDIPAAMRFGEETLIAQETEGQTLTRDCLYFGKPAEILSRFVADTGAPALPPEWSFGVWISGNGWNCDAEVDAQLAALSENRYPASIMVLEQWSDERTFYLWHPTHWRDPAALVRRVRAAGLHLVLWQIPVIKHEWDGHPGDALARDTREALDHGYTVTSEDGSPCRITERWFHHSLLPDFTNPDAARWWFDRRKPLLDMGVEGFKTDGGEFLFEKTARLHDGSTGLTAHNRYPGQYVGAYHDFMRQHGVNGVTFSRAGYTGAQTQPIHWAGDQVSEWSELQAQLCAGLSAGLSGVLFWSFDIGGFAGPIPSAELYLRATAMGCFCPVMQWHAEPRGGQFSGGLGEGYNNDRSPWNLAEKLGDGRVLTVGCAFANLRETLRPYLWQEAQHCAKAARPMMAHLCLDWPDDARVWSTQDEYMLGRELLVAPLTRAGEDTRAVYLPKGEWEEYFTGETVEGPRELRVTCPLDRIPVYRRRDAHAACAD